MKINKGLFTLLIILLGCNDKVTDSELTELLARNNEFITAKSSKDYAGFNMEIFHCDSVSTELKQIEKTLNDLRNLTHNSKINILISEEFDIINSHYTNYYNKLKFIREMTIPSFDSTHLINYDIKKLNFNDLKFAKQILVNSMLWDELHVSSKIREIYSIKCLNND